MALYFLAGLISHTLGFCCTKSLVVFDKWRKHYKNNHWWGYRKHWQHIRKLSQMYIRYKWRFFFFFTIFHLITVLLLLFWGHIWRCSGVISTSEFRNHLWQAQRTYMGCEGSNLGRLCINKASALPSVLFINPTPFQVSTFLMSFYLSTYTIHIFSHKIIFLTWFIICNQVMCMSWIVVLITNQKIYAL